MTRTLSELRRVHQLLCSRFVDAAWFEAALGDSRADLGCTARYLAIPADCRPPLTPYFDSVFYRAAYPDAATAGTDPLLHFIEHGFADFRMPHPLIDQRYLLSIDRHALGSPRQLEHLVELLEHDLLAPSAYFDPAWYREALGSRAPAGASLRHFLQTGIHEGWRPNAMLDLAWYSVVHTDAPRDRMGALRHAVLIGDRQGRAMSPEFDGTLYRASNLDVADSSIPALAHFVAWGRAEGRRPVPPRHASGRQQEPPTRARLVSADAAQSPPDSAPLPEAYDAMKARLAAAEQARIQAFRPRPFRMLRCKNPAVDAAALRLPTALTPAVSILIPAFNEVRVTIECLMAIVKSRIRAPYEVVIADDASADPAIRLLDGVPNLRIVRQALNRGFIRNCNAGFLQCRAPYVLLLNNDTQVQPGAVDRLLAVLQARPRIAAAGAKLVYPNGRLQEAGCSLDVDGTSVMVGLNHDPDEGGFCFDRDVAYCSAAALMVRRACVGDQLFDPRYEPAYCEDADLCMQFKASGHRVRYVHDAVVVHHLGASVASMTRKMRTVVRNQQALAERWAPQLRAMNRVRAIAFYLPQFHPTPENDLWWGKGFTEWTNVSKARPTHAGHHQPHLPADLGFYDLRATEALTAQANLAARYGIDGFCVYYYNMAGTPMLSRPIEAVRRDPSIPFRWCLCWANENWTRRWDGGNQELLSEQRYDDATLDSVIAAAIEQAGDKRYIRVNGLPLMLVYRPLLIPDPADFAARCRAAFAAAGFAGVHLVYVESMETASGGITPAELGFDASVEFPPHGHGVEQREPVEDAVPGYVGVRYSYPDTVLAFAGRARAAHPRYPAVFPAWDNTPRQPLRANSFTGATPEVFRAYVEQKVGEAAQSLVGDERLLFVNAWNEWAEGAHLEPDTLHGHRWLEALRDGMGMSAA